ncbi:MAG TPA: radical SAM family heme chaperone HemW [Candidatus Eremiobacteraceae bacterium]|nr:radical SAM family heme chaperone HemW [Candidatus Eremiobacteraceae bacterium]
MFHPLNDPTPRESTGDDAAGVYVHIPFCDRICPYCDFAVVRTRESAIDRYCAALHAEIGRSSGPRRVGTVYFGGGTPSAIGPDRIAALTTFIFEKFTIAPDSIECTLEANPSRGGDDIRRWREAGVNRLSVGVQSFDDAELRRLGRDHSSADAAEFLRAARSAGFENISLDLIAGSPGQSLEGFRDSLRSAVATGVDHVSVYGLTIEAATPYATWFAREPQAFPDDDLVAALLEEADCQLTAAGFVHYEISNFARPGFESAHNRGYWRQADCAAFGMSAAGYRDGVRFVNVRGFDAYCEAIEAHRSAIAELELLDFGRRVGEAAMLALRTSDGIIYDEFERRFGVDARAIFGAARKKCSAAGLLEESAAGAHLSSRGRLLANSVCAEFLTPDLPRNEHA